MININMKDMKKFLKQTMALALLIGACSACTAEKEEGLYYEDGIVNLDGPWASEQMAFTEEDAQLAVITTSKEK